ncbi:MAG TPA: DegT/DnrJ/EryC1/StrS aminotransferase family protein [Polyangiales bacterium]
MRQTFLPYNLPLLGDEEIAGVLEVLQSGWLTTGKRAQEFEAVIREITGARYAVALNSCTAGLHLSLLALGIGPGDEVIVPDMTFCATINVVIHVGATPVVVDVTRDTYHIDPDAIERAITPRTKAIIPVHYAGQACDMDRILAIAKAHNLYVVEDAAHSIGVTHRGRQIGTLGNTTSFSFYVTKNVTTAEGGAVTTDDEAIADRIRRLSLHGISRDAWKRYSAEGSWYYEVLEPGWKCNLTDLAAAIGIPQLRRMPAFYARRTELAERITKGLQGLPGISTPRSRPDSSNIWHLYVIEVDAAKAGISRDELIEQLKKRNIGTSVHFIPLHRHPAYRAYGLSAERLPVAEEVFTRIVSLPLYPKMTDQDADDVVEAVRELVKP